MMTLTYMIDHMKIHQMRIKSLCDKTLSKLTSLNQKHVEYSNMLRFKQKILI